MKVREIVQPEPKTVEQDAPPIHALAQMLWTGTRHPPGTALADMVRSMGHDDIASELDRAQAEEEQHVHEVRAWIEAAHRLASE